MDYGEVIVREEAGNVIVAVTGTDDEGSFTAASTVPVDEFMAGEENYLEQLIGSVLFYNKVYKETEE